MKLKKTHLEILRRVGAGQVTAMANYPHPTRYGWRDGPYASGLLNHKSVVKLISYGYIANGPKVMWLTNKGRQALEAQA